MAESFPLMTTLTPTELAFLTSRTGSSSGPVATALGVPTEVDPAGGLAFQGLQSLVARDLLAPGATPEDQATVVPFVALIGGAVSDPVSSLLIASTHEAGPEAVRIISTRTARLAAGPGPFGVVRFSLLGDGTDLLSLVRGMAGVAFGRQPASFVLGWEVRDGVESTDGMAASRDGDIVTWRINVDGQEAAGACNPGDLEEPLRRVVEGWLPGQIGGSGTHG